jgi:hypothetical protein
MQKAAAHLAFIPRPQVPGPPSDRRAYEKLNVACDVGESDNRRQINYLTVDTEALLSFTCTGDAPRIVVVFASQEHCPTGVPSYHRISQP